MGLTATTDRKISVGTKYNQYFDSPKGKIVLIKDGDTYDTLHFMRDWVKKYGDQTKKFVNAELKGLPLNQLCRKLEDWQMKHFRYRLDGLDPERPGAEEIHTPNMQWQKRHIGIDCDDYALFASSCLTQLNIPHSLRKADYGQGWQHVYVIVPTSPNYHPLKRHTYYCIDPVLDGLNNEKDFTKKYDLNMKIYGLSGINTGNSAATLMGVATGEDFNHLLGGLGDVSEKMYDTALFNHLAKTYNVLNVNDAGNGAKIIKNENDRNIFLSFLGRILNNWENRNDIIPQVEAQHKQAEKSGLITLTTEEGEGLSGLWKRIKKGVAKATEKVANTVKDVAAKAKDFAVNTYKKGVELVKKYNPVAIIMRKAIQMVLKYNYKGLATVIYVLNSPKVLERLSGGNKNIIKKGNSKILNLYKRFEGDPNKFYDLAKEGADRRPFMQEGKIYKDTFGKIFAWQTIKQKGLAGGLGADPTTITTAISAGAAAVTSIVIAISKSLKEANEVKKAIDEAFNAGKTPSTPVEPPTTNPPIINPNPIDPVEIDFNRSPAKKGLSTGAKVGIGVGVAAILGVGAALVMKKKNKKALSGANSGVGHVVIN